jgi:hypothetical protein
MIEAPYAFRRTLEAVHKTDRRNPAATANANEITIDDTWSIVVPKDAAKLIHNVARDLQDYFQVSMDTSLPIHYVDDLEANESRIIAIGTGSDLPSVEEVPTTPRSYRIVVDPARIVLCGADERGAAQACYFLEDTLNMRQGPFISPMSEARSPIFSPRMTHSGWGLDEFPDAYLNQVAHAGMDSILLFTSGPNRTPDEVINRDPHQPTKGRYKDFNNIVDRCEEYGLDVYLYAYFHNARPLHPDDPGAERFYEETYGAAFKACPRAKGIILVGESVEFPSHDPRTTGRMRLDPIPGNLPVDKPSPGWWPCEDYPQWVSMVRDSVRKYSPDAEIVFWTYNWGWAPEEDRLKLIRSLPTDINLHVTFEMFEPIEHDGVTNVCVDYTAAFVGPGTYFASEAAAAHERGITLSTMCNTGGLTWDFGVIPYQPIPYQWNRRHDALKKAHDDWNLTGLMECHHFGWWPSFVSDLAKWNYWSPSPSGEETIANIARRDFGDGAAKVVSAWELWSDAANDYPPTNGDQYGPFRVGPTYPLTLFTNPKITVADHAMFGDLILKTPYAPDQGGTKAKTAATIRTRAEIVSLSRMLDKWQEGLRLLDEAIGLAPAYRRPEGERMANLGQFIAHSIRTTINVKKWWLLKNRALVEEDPATAETLLDHLVQVGEDELANAEAAIPVVEADSRLGWEPTMEYLGDAEHIRWKIAHLRHALDHEIPAYRASLPEAAIR